MPNTLLGEVGSVVMIQKIPRNAFFCHHKLSLTSLKHDKATYLQRMQHVRHPLFIIIIIIYYIY